MQPMEQREPPLQYLCSGDIYHFFPFSGCTKKQRLKYSLEIEDDSLTFQAVPELKNLALSFCCAHLECFSNKQLQSIPPYNPVFHEFSIQSYEEVSFTNL